MFVLQSDTLTAHILPRGATLAGLWVKGHSRSLVLGFTDPSGYDTSAFYAGAIVGPVANRVTRGQVCVGDRVYHMPANEGATCLHSGENGLHALNWHACAQTDASVTLETTLKDGAVGLPGLRHVTAEYRLGPGSELSLSLSATSDCDTVMNIAHHPYWNLDDAPDVSMHHLQIDADAYLDVDARNLPTGRILSVAGSDYDFREARLVPVDRSLDANLCIRPARATTPREIATLTGSTGIRLHIASTEPGLQVYNGAGLPHSGPRLLPGQMLAPYYGIALEPQGWPDAPNHAHFPSISLPAGATYRQTTCYRIAMNSFK